MVDNSVLTNEAGEIKREQELHLGRLEKCNDMKDIKAEFINHLENEYKIREKYTKHKIEFLQGELKDRELNTKKYIEEVEEWEL